MELLWYLLLGALAVAALCYLTAPQKEYMISEYQKEQEEEVESEAEEEEEGDLADDSGFAGAPTYDLL